MELASLGGSCHPLGWTQLLLHCQGEVNPILDFLPAPLFHRATVTETHEVLLAPAPYTQNRKDKKQPLHHPSCEPSNTHSWNSVWISGQLQAREETVLAGEKREDREMRREKRKYVSASPGDPEPISHEFKRHWGRLPTERQTVSPAPQTHLGSQLPLRE